MSDKMKELPIEEPPQKYSFGWRTVLGMVCCAFACCFFTGMNGFSKHLYNTCNITVWEVMYWRSLALVVLNSIAAQLCGDSILRIPKKLEQALLWKVLTGIVGVSFVFYQLKVMSFSKATAIFFIYPGFAMIFAYLLMHEKITRYDILSTIVSFVGVIVIVFDPNGTKKINDVEEEPVWAPIVPIMASVFCALTDVYTRVLGSDVHFSVSPGYFGFGTAAFGFIMMQLWFSSSNTITNYNFTVGFYVFLVATSGFVGQVLLTKAFQLEKAGRIAIISYLQVVNACLVDIFLFRIPMRPLQYFGIFLIVSSGGSLMILKGFDIIK